ncbi:methyltransferase domain-containing protein [Calothrix sp. PCC 6303]|uniref:methyltransferase domain-containing protein n=1 Tax=Calothrix sp. PCC 6303 TaxID=1170562 RepID=UPI0002A05759|nr:methyltransferase domain-containing protein [Calothrix sp. PCC 6303]AFY99993.1 thiopurine S-methyltransferase [Calothrix sp. PCC 6303]
MPNQEYWEQCYQEGNTRWDLGTAAPPFLSLLKSENPPSPGRVAVLGCGRGYDAILFAKYGFEVVGFDFTVAAIRDATTLAKSENISAEFLQRDIFDLPGEFAGEFDYVIEHTCFCAIARSLRLDYVQLVKSILKPQGQLIGLFFTHSRPDGPPFGTNPAEIREYFQPDFEILSLKPVLNSVPSRQGEEHLGRFQVVK